MAGLQPGRLGDGAWRPLRQSVLDQRHAVLQRPQLRWPGRQPEYDFDGGDLGLFGNLAVVPLEYTSDSAPSQSRVKTPNENKWLSGAQVGVNWRFNDGTRCARH